MVLSVCVPCFNEQDVLQEFYSRVIGVLQTVGTDSEPVFYELIFADDGSTDGTFTAIKKISAENPYVRYVSFTRNFGKEAALYALLQRAQGDFICILDADLQDPPELIPKMLAAIQNGGDCCAARRTGFPKNSIRNFCTILFYRFFNLFSDIKLECGERDYRVMSRRMVDTVLSMPERFRFSKGIYAWTGFTAKTIEYEPVKRCRGVSKWSFLKLFDYAADAVFTFSDKSMKIVIGFGFLLMLLAVISGLACFIIGVLNRTAGAAALFVCLFVFLAGLQLSATGIAGLCVFRCWAELKQRPQFIVREEK
ncbi:glycosyltransferase family 2 protein [Treponema brennaborense]|uniref:Glycosyl transferase family 2 n=1 Tax=Treponema brennaborense (strain DSM 12168 / CIP 105900 / DD5/3) TaxID=906968 RepID=F4LNB7_TREBD|nr:glycosyltransferase family 2 protein [Treponema brennaborense]AEE17875.1 glycosyl transferase family 2 [Treponema brennaborense DSM 12168]